MVNVLERKLRKTSEQKGYDPEKRKALAEALKANPSSPEAAKAYTRYLEQHVLPAMRKEAKPYSFQEYFALALEQGIIALREGNYAIGAVYVYRANGQEHIIGGRNRTVSEKNTHLHAEEDVLDMVETLDRGNKLPHDRIIANRQAPHSGQETILMSSLEPCPGCYRRLTTHKPGSVWIATPDVTGGAMLDGRQQQLPGIWATRREKRGIGIATPSDDPHSLFYINPIYRDIALEMFETTQKYIDDTTRGIRSNPDKFAKRARQSSRRGIFRALP